MTADSETPSTTVQTDIEIASTSINIDLAEPSTISKTDSIIPSSNSTIDFKYTDSLIHNDMKNNKGVLSNNAVFIEKDSKYKRRYEAIVKENFRLRHQLKLQSKQYKSKSEQKKF